MKIQNISIHNFSADNFYDYSLREMIKSDKSLRLTTPTTDGQKKPKINKVVLIIDGDSLSVGGGVIRDHILQNINSIIIISSGIIINLLRLLLSKKSERIIWINKSSSRNEILISLRTEGKPPLDRVVSKHILVRNEIKTFRLYLNGFSHSEISCALGLSYKAISRYKNKTLKSLGVKNLSCLLSITTLYELRAIFDFFSF